MMRIRNLVIRILLVALTGHNFATGATTKAPNCDQHMLTTLQMLTKLTDLALDAQALTVEELKAAFATTPFTDPLLTKAADSENANLKTGFARALARVRAADVSTLREKLNERLQKATGDLEIAHQASVATRTVFSPHILSRTASGSRLAGRVDSERADWHHDAEGRLQWVVFDRHNFVLSAYSPENATTPVWSEPAFGPDNEHILGQKISGKSFSGGEYIVAFDGAKHRLDPKSTPTPSIPIFNPWSLFIPMPSVTTIRTSTPSEKRELNIYRHRERQTDELEVDGYIWDIKTTADANGTPYVVALTKNSIELFEVTAAGPRLHRKISGSFNQGGKVSDDAEITVSAVSSDGKLKVFRPLISDEPLAAWALPPGEVAIFPHVLANGRTVIAAFTGEKSGHLMVFDTQSNVVRQMASPNAWPTPAWHDNDAGETMFFYATRDGARYNLQVLKPLQDSGPELKIDKTLPANSVVGNPMVNIVRSPVDGRELLVIPSRQERPGQDDLANLRIFDLATLTDLAPNSTVPNGHLHLLVQKTGEVLAVGMNNSKLQIFDLLTNERLYEIPYHGLGYLPIVEDEKGRAILPMTGGPSENCSLTFFAITDNGPEGPSKTGPEGP